ncbi:Ribonucleoprotein PTB-binding 1 [Bagarius yarrelli]|uniref:Ribonucleoprotein PTB-binding 1 n=1 Tax=Bagarius yarrelli TaxID=175774 RepID=A0A556V890_BAGYA|nr:Ribonucleoprotein PTB-binding 1 [Bagarius yarrelli]
MAAAASVNRAAGEDQCCAGTGLTTQPLYEHCDQAKSKKWAAETRRESEADYHSDEAAVSEYPRRAEEELTALSTEEVASRLERTRREFYNRRKILIKNLPADITNQVQSLPATNTEFTFVTLLNGEQAQCAIKEFHQQALREREISVQLQPTDALLCIANLPRAFTQQQFEELVRPFGNLERCFLVHSACTGHSKGYGFVEYMKKDSAARAKSELLGKQLGSRMLYVHWTEVGSLTYATLHSRCLCVDRLPASLLSAQALLSALADMPEPTFCQLAQGQDGSFRRFAILEYSTPELAEEVQRLTDGRPVGGGHIRVSFCAPGPPGRSMLAALIAAQTLAINRGKGLLPEPSAMQILSSLSNPATLKLLLASLNQGQKQGLLGAAPVMPLLTNPALSAALVQLLLQNQVQQQAGLLGENPLATLSPLQQGINMLSDPPHGALGVQTEPLGPLPLGRTLGIEPDSINTQNSFTTHPSALQGMSAPLLGSVMGGDGATLALSSLLGEPPKEISVSPNPFLNSPSIFPASAAGNSRPHPYRKRPVLGDLANQRSMQSIHPNYSLRCQDSYEFSAGHQYSRHGAISERTTPFPYSSSPPGSSYFSFGAPGSAPHTQLNKAVAKPPMTPSSVFSAAPGSGAQTPVGGQKRLFSWLIPSPEPSPEGGYVGQHSQGLGGHYADSYLKRKRIF